MRKRQLKKNLKKANYDMVNSDIFRNIIQNQAKAMMLLNETKNIPMYNILDNVRAFTPYSHNKNEYIEYAIWNSELLEEDLEDKGKEIYSTLRKSILGVR